MKAASDRATVGRHPGDAARSAIAAAVFAGSALLVTYFGVSRLEADLFRVFNHLPRPAAVVLLPVLELGSAVAIAVASAVALLGARVRLGLKLAVAGAGAWVITHLVASVVDRPVPPLLLDAVATPGGNPGGDGFPSSNVAVATALAMVAIPYLTVRARRWLWSVVALVGVAAMYAGRSLPLDVIGGAALGWWEGALIHAVGGAPGRRASPEQIRAALEAAGLEPKQVQHVRGRAWRAAEYVVTTTTGDELTARVQRRKWKRPQAVYRLRRLLASVESLEEHDFATPKHEVEHEAYVALLAERAGVRTPPVLLARELDSGSALLVRARVAGTTLGALRDAQVSDPQLTDVWRQLACLRQARLAHHELTPETMIVDDKGQVWIVDFRAARAGASDARLAQDVAELLVCLAAVTEAPRAVATAHNVVGVQALGEALPYLQPLALPTPVRRVARARPDLLAALRAEVAERTGVAPPRFRPRVRASTLLSLAVLGGAIYILLPQLGNVSELTQAVARAQWSWLALAALAAALTFPAAGWSYMGAVERQLPVARTTAVQLASAFTSRLTPAGVGGLGLNAIYFERAGVGRRKAVGAVALSHAAGAVVHALGVFAALAFIGSSGIGGVEVPTGWPILVAVLGGLVAAGLFLSSPFGRRRLVRPALGVMRELGRVVRQPGRAVALFGGSAGVTLANALCLAACLAAFTSDFPVLQVIAVYVGGSAIAAPAPTPGALGAVEAALVAGLTGIGISPGPAVAAVLTFRLLSFWLPILPGLAAFRYLQHKRIV